MKPPMIQITAQIENHLADMAGRHLPFVTSMALNRTANDARDAVRENLPKRFRLKRTSIPKTIKVLTSTKANLVAHVIAPGFLSIHETGGEMLPTSSSLLAAKADGVTTRVLRNRAGTFRRDMGDGRAAVFKRTGRKGRGGIRLLAWLSPEHEFEERFHMEDDVRETVQARFGANFRDALGVALSGR
jgi:hypothetical protein